MLRSGTPHGGVRAQVVPRDQPATALHLADDQGRRLSLVETSRTGVLNSLEGRGKFGLPEPGTIAQSAKILREVGALEARLFCPGPLSQQGWNVEPTLRELHRGLDHVAPRQPPVTLMRCPEPRYGAGHTDSAMSRQARAFDHFTGGIEVHVARGGRGRRLAVVEELRGAIDVSQHEAASAKVAGFRVGHGQHQGACHGCVNGVAPG